MNKLILTVVLLIGLLVTGCTENQVARTMGGTSRVEIPAGQKVVTATWKDTDLWVLYRPRHEGETAETLTLKEYSNLGMVQGTMILQEH